MEKNRVRPLRIGKGHVQVRFLRRVFGLSGDIFMFWFFGMPTKPTKASMSLACVSNLFKRIESKSLRIGTMPMACASPHVVATFSAPPPSARRSQGEPWLANKEHHPFIYRSVLLCLSHGFMSSGFLWLPLQNKAATTHVAKHAAATASFGCGGKGP